MPARRPPRPPSIIAERLAACRAKIQQKSVDGYLITNRVDQFYLTGFDGEDGAVLILPRRVGLLTDGRFLVESAAIKWATAIIRKGSFAELLGKMVRRYRIGRLGFQPAHLNVAAHAAIRKAIRPARLVAMPSIESELRLYKSPDEVAAIVKAVRVAESAFRAVVKQIRPGMTERQLAGALQYEMICRGASEASFPIIVAEGPNGARPHAVPGDRKIRRSSSVLIDWGATVDHYRSDLTRVIFVRRIPPRFRRIYDHVLAAQRAGIEAIRPGAKMGDVDAAARGRLVKAGMGKRFSHSLGHGLGLDIHESPRLARKVTDRLKPGMVVTVEPGVYYPGFGGVRIEDDVLVTETGHRVLSRLSKDIEDMVV